MLWLGLLWGIVWAFQETLFFALAMDIADAKAEQLMPHYREMYLRAGQKPLSIERRLIHPARR